MRKLDVVLHDKLATLIESMGYEFVGGELSSQNRQTIFRLFIDSKTGVTVDDCSKVSRQVGAMLEVEQVFQGAYALEVSSPGIDRPLFEIKHYQQFIGSQIKIRLHAPIQQQRQFKGLLKGVEGENIHLIIDGSEQEVILPYTAIEKANVIGDITL